MRFLVSLVAAVLSTSSSAQDFRCENGSQPTFVSELSNDEIITLNEKDPLEFTYAYDNVKEEYVSVSVGVDLPYRLARRKDEFENLDKAYPFRYVTIKDDYVMLFGSTVFEPVCK